MANQVFMGLKTLKFSLDKKGWLFFSLGFVFLALFILLYVYRETINDYAVILARAIDMNPIAGVLIFLAISALSTIFSPFSSLPLLQPAIVAWGKMLTLFYLMLGWTLGSVLGYAIGYYALSGIARKLFSFKKIDYYQKSISSETQFWMVLVFRLGVPTEITGYILGIMRYHFKKYILAVILSELPFALISVYSSSALFGGQIIFLSALIIMAIALIGATSLILKKYIKK